MVGDPKMTIHGWRQLAEWSIEHSCLDHNQRAQLKGTFEQEWESFCQWVVEEYGEYAIGLEHV
jgi:adenosine deaminase CECR1